MATKRSRPEPGAPRAGDTPAQRAVPADAVSAPARPRARPAAERVSPDVYNAFIRGVNLLSIRLAGAEVRAQSTPERKQLLPKVDRKSRFVNGDQHVQVTHELTFTARYEGEEEPAVFIRADFEVRYSTATRMTPQIFAEFRKRNLPLNTWPYFREFVQATLARAGWPVFTLPVYSVPGTTLPSS